jgi:hypothetical protein
MTSKDTTITIPAHASQGWQKGSPWVVTVGGAPIYASDKSIVKARAQAGEEAARLIANVTELPALVRDGDGSLWVLTPHADGHRCMRLRPDDTVSGCTSFGGGTPAEAADSIVRNHEGSVRLA